MCKLYAIQSARLQNRFCNWCSETYPNIISLTSDTCIYSTHNPFYMSTYSVQLQTQVPPVDASWLVQIVGFQHSASNNTFQDQEEVDKPRVLFSKLLQHSDCEWQRVSAPNMLGASLTRLVVLKICATIIGKLCPLLLDVLPDRDQGQSALSPWKHHYHHHQECWHHLRQDVQKQTNDGEERNVFQHDSFLYEVNFPVW